MSPYTACCFSRFSSLCQPHRGPHFETLRNPFQLLPYPWKLNTAQESKNLELLASGKPQRFQQLGLCSYKVQTSITLPLRSSGSPN